MAEIVILANAFSAVQQGSKTSDESKRLTRIWSEGAAILPGSASNPAGAAQQSG